jgi:hypothetical protein
VENTRQSGSRGIDLGQISFAEQRYLCACLLIGKSIRLLTCENCINPRNSWVDRNLLLPRHTIHNFEMARLQASSQRGLIGEQLHIDAVNQGPQAEPQ